MLRCDRVDGAVRRRDPLTELVEQDEAAVILVSAAPMMMVMMMEICAGKMQRMPHDYIHSRRGRERVPRRSH